MASTPNDVSSSSARRDRSTDILFPEPADSSFTAFDTVVAHATPPSSSSVSSYRNSSYEVQQYQTQQSQPQQQQQQQQLAGRANSVSSFSQASATPPRLGSASQSSSPYASSQVSVELRRNSSSVSDAGRANIPSYQEAMARRGGDEMMYRSRGSTDSNGSKNGSYVDITQSNTSKNTAAKPPAAPTAVTGPSPSKYGRPSPSSSSTRSSQYHSTTSTARGVAPHHPPLPPTSGSYRSNTDSQQQQPNVGRASRTPPPQVPPPPIPNHGTSSISTADETSSTRKGQPPMRFPPPPPYPPPPLSECDRPPPTNLVTKRRPSDSSSIYSITSNGSSVSTRCAVQQPAPNPRGPPVNMATSLQKAGLIRPVAYKPVASNSPMSPYAITVNGRPPSCQSAPPTDYLTPDGRRDGEVIPADSVVVYTDTEDFEQRLQRSLSEDPAPRCSSSQSHRGSKAKNRHLNLEEALKEKDREIQNLRDTMEKNEKVIVDVYNDKQRWWREEMDTITKDHKEKMKVQDTRSVKMDEMLGTQIGGLKDDIKKLKDNKEQLNDEIGLVEKRLTDLKQHLGEVKSALSETGWEVKQKNGEISLLKNQLKEVSNTGREAQNQVMGLRVQLKDANQDIEDKENKIAITRNEVDSAQTKINQLKEESNELDEQEKSEELRARKVASDTVSINEEMRKLREMFDANESMMEDQRKGWIEEKARLILFQKQLQLNYIQMTQRTNSLDAEMHQLLTSLRELGHEVEVDWSHESMNGNVGNELGSTASTPTSGSGGPSGNRPIQLMPLPFEDIWGSSNGVNVDAENRNNTGGDANTQSTIC